MTTELADQPGDGQPVSGAALQVLVPNAVARNNGNALRVTYNSWHPVIPGADKCDDLGPSLKLRSPLHLDRAAVQRATSVLSNTR